MWYQGENNGANPGSWMKNQGYACMLPRLINNWRRDWIFNNHGSLVKYNISSNVDNFVATNIAANELMPFGVVSLHPWCGEETSNCYHERDYSDITTTYDPTMYAKSIYAFLLTFFLLLPQTRLHTKQSTPFPTENELKGGKKTVACFKMYIMYTYYIVCKRNDIFGLEFEKNRNIKTK